MIGVSCIDFIIVMLPLVESIIRMLTYSFIDTVNCMSTRHWLLDSI